MALVHKFDKLVPKFANLVPEKKWRAIKPETAKEGEEDLQQKLLWLLIRVPAQLNVTNFFLLCGTSYEDSPKVILNTRGSSSLKVFVESDTGQILNDFRTTTTSTERRVLTC